MCSEADHPPYDAPVPTRPRRYELSGDGPSEPRPSVALAVIGTMLDELDPKDDSDYGVIKALVLLEVRDRITKAERDA